MGNVRRTQPFAIGTQMFQFMVFKITSWDYKTLNFDTDIDATNKIENGVINAMDPNLKSFFAHGGKLIQYHGRADRQIPSVPALSTIRVCWIRWAASAK